MKVDLATYVLIIFCNQMTSAYDLINSLHLRIDAEFAALLKRRFSVKQQGIVGSEAHQTWREYDTSSCNHWNEQLSGKQSEPQFKLALLACNFLAMYVQYSIILHIN